MKLVVMKANVISYNAVIDVCAKSGGKDQVADWSSKALETGVKPDIISYLIIEIRP